VQQPGVVVAVVASEDLSAGWGALGEAVPDGGHRLVGDALRLARQSGPLFDLGRVAQEEADGLVLDPGTA
jgi:hypothetical protein